MLDMIIRGATLPDGRANIDIGIQDGKITAVEPNLQGEAGEIIDATGRLVTPPFADAHVHMDSTLSLGLPRLNESGTLLEGIALWGELKPHLTVEAIYERAKKLCLWSIARGTLAIRSHVDICDDRLLAVEALAEAARTRCALPGHPARRLPAGRVICATRIRAANLQRALDMGVDVVGGIPHFERTMEEGAASVKALMRIAAERGTARGHALRRDRRPALAPYRDPGGRDRAARACRGASPARTSPPCIPWIITMSAS